MKFLAPVSGEAAIPSDNQPPPRPCSGFTALIEAEEGFPALERAALEAERSIWACFRIFDPLTATRSKEARELGLQTWRELLDHVAEKGVQIRFMVSDFDPIGAPGLHEGCWSSVYALKRLSEGNGDRDVEVIAARHEARVGRGLRFTFYLYALKKLRSQLLDLNELETDERQKIFHARPGIWRHLRIRSNGRIGWRSARLPLLFPVTHHQKLAVFDGNRAILGGLDVDERRYDDHDHSRPAEQTWHDVSVEVDGPVAVDAARHFAEGWNRDRRRAAADLRGFSRRAPERLDAPSEPAPALDVPETGDLPEAEGEEGVQLVLTRSIARRFQAFRMSPRTVSNGLERAHEELFRSAERLIFVETQFFRHRPIAKMLARCAQERPELNLLMVLPMAPEDAAFGRSDGLDVRKGEALQAECCDIVQDAFGERAFFMSPLRPVASESDGRDANNGREIIYVHAKVAIADDATALVSSANLNGRSMRWDTEAGVLIRHPDEVAGLRERLFRAWLPKDAPAAAFDPATAVAEWRRMAHEALRHPPSPRFGFLAPHDKEATERYGIDVPLAPDELV